MSSKPYTFDRVTRIVISVLTIAVIIYLLIITKAALVPFFIAWLVAYLINPIVLKVQKMLKIKSKIIAVLIVLLLLTSLVVGISWLFIPRLIDEFQKFFAIANVYFTNNTIGDLFPSELNQEITTFLKESDFISSLSAGDASSIIGRIFIIAWGVISESFSLILTLVSSFLAVLYLVFILKDYENITQGAINLIPPKYKSMSMAIINDVEDGMNRYFRGQATVALLVGLMLALGFHIISLPLGIFLGLFIGLLNLVPYLQVIGIVPMALVAFLKSTQTGESFFFVFALALGVLAIVQVIQDSIIVPRIMGKVTGLNPAIILLSLSVWGALLGVIGMIIALPFTTILLSYYKRFIVNKEVFEEIIPTEIPTEEEK